MADVMGWGSGERLDAEGKVDDGCQGIEKGEGRLVYHSQRKGKTERETGRGRCTDAKKPS